MHGKNGRPGDQKELMVRASHLLLLFVLVSFGFCFICFLVVMVLCCCCFYFKTGFHYIALSTLELACYIDEVGLEPIEIPLLSTGTKEICCHTQPSLISRVMSRIP